jgi:phospholipid/cholesterol/gamma-HCH transport system substrate-binding protein
MSTYRRNVLVGITVLIALGALGWMIILFGGDIGKLFAGETMPIKFKTDRADGLSGGSAIWYRGVNVGRVLKVTRDPDQITIMVEGAVDAKPPLPANMTAYIKQTSLLGSGSGIILESHGDTGISAPVMKPGDEIPLRYVGLDLFPPAMSELSKSLSETVKQINDAKLFENLNKRLDQVGLILEDTRATLGNVNKLIGDEKIRNDISTSLDNIRVASENVRSVTARADKIATNIDKTVDTLDKTVNSANDTVKSTQTHIDELAKQTHDRMEQLGKLMAEANDITTKINDGKGTAGKIINDPKLYEGLVETTTQLNATIRDLQRLVQQWEQEGVSLKLH